MNSVFYTIHKFIQNLKEYINTDLDIKGYLRIGWYPTKFKDVYTSGESRGGRKPPKHPDEIVLF